MRPTAAMTSGNRERCPAWNTIGSSASIRNWLKVNPSGLTSGTKVESR
jgi:hypothetical protein